MSRHEIEHPKYAIALGWDRPLNTFFCTVSEPDPETEEEKILIWIGGGKVGEYQDARLFLEEVQKQMDEKKIADVTLPDSFVATLEQDQRAEGEGFQQRSLAIQKFVLDGQKDIV
jgi:hypothetical protein